MVVGLCWMGWGPWGGALWLSMWLGLAPGFMMKMLDFFLWCWRGGEVSVGRGGRGGMTVTLGRL